VVTQYNYRGGPAVYAEGGWLLFGNFNMSYTVLCERATLDFDLSRGAEALVLTEQGKAPRVIKSVGGDGYGGELSYMLEAVRSGKAPKIVTAKDGLSAVEICEAEAKSVRTGKVVAV
jgi:predicted dehydrogenase